MVDRTIQPATTNGLINNNGSNNFIQNLLNSLLSSTIGQTSSAGSVVVIPGVSSGLGIGSGGGSSSPGSSPSSGVFSSSSGLAGYNTNNTSPVNFSASTNGNDKIKYIGKFDVNKDRVLSKEEILDYFINARKTSTPVDNDIFLASDESAEIYRALNNIDTNPDGTISDPEAAITLLKIKNPRNNLDPEISKFILNRLNRNITNIEAKLNKLDLNNNGSISTLELLNSIKLAKSNEINLADADIDALLRTNSKYQSLIAVINNFGTSSSGTPSDQDVFNILLSLRGNSQISQEALNKALFLGSNSNAFSIENSLGSFDSQADGNLTDEELITTLMKIRSGELNPAEHKAAVDLLDGIPQYKKIKDAVSQIDANADGRVSDDEIIDLVLISRRSDINIDDGLLSKLVPDSAKLNLVKSQVSSVDKDNNGIISDQEYIQSISDLNNQNLSSIAQGVLGKILKRNPNSQSIQNVLNFVDKDSNSIISAGELTQAVLAYYRGETQSLNQDYFIMALDLNSNRNLIQGIIDQINPNHSGLVDSANLTRFFMSYKLNNPNLDPSLAKSIIQSFPDGNKIVDTVLAFDTDRDGFVSLREYTQGYINIKKGLISNPGNEILGHITNMTVDGPMVRDFINLIDSDNNGTISAAEFTTNFNKALVGTDGKTDLRKIELISNLKDIIYPAYAEIENFKNAVDINKDNILSDNELIDALLKINSGELQTPAADITDLIFSANPNKSDLIHLVNDLDKDKDGTISDTELTYNLIRVRRGEFPQYSLGLVQAILNKNPKFSEIQSMLDLFDKDQNGIVSDIEMFDAFIKIKGGKYSGQVIPEALDAIRALNPNSANIEALVDNLDPNKNGIVDYDELIQALLKVNSGTLNISNEIKLAIPGPNGLYGSSISEAERTVGLFDKDKNGQISDLEIASITLGYRQTHNLDSYDPNFVIAAFKTNPNSAKIGSLINNIDKDGDGHFSNTETIQAILNQRKDPNTFGADFGLVQNLLGNYNSSYSTINNLINSMDQDGNGNVSNIEAMKAIINDVRNPVSVNDRSIFNEILFSNPEANSIVSAFIGFEVNPNSSNIPNDLFKAWFKIQQGSKPGAYFNELVEGLGQGAALNNLISQYRSLDSDRNGQVGTEEFGNFLVSMRANHSVSAENSNMANLLGQLDPSLGEIKSIVDSFDPDADGYTSERGILDGVIKLRRLGKENLMNSSFIQNILNSNAYTSPILKIINLVDPNHSGILNNASVMPFWQNIQARYGSVDPAYDFNGNGSIDYGDMASIYALLAIANNRYDLPFKIYGPETTVDFANLFHDSQH